MEIGIFTFNPFQENTYVIHDDTKECIVIDPGCSNHDEEQQLTDYITSRNLKVVMLVNTHCHIDHVLGNNYVAKTYGLKLCAHKDEKAVLDANVMVSQMYGMPYTLSPPIEVFLEEGKPIKFGNTELEVFFTPGHSPASLSFFHRPSSQLIAGDVLFKGSIGRTDLPGGNYDTLIESIKTKYYPLGDDVIVYPGHGPATTLLEEKLRNPFLQ